MKAVGARIRHVRKLARLTQGQFAKRLSDVTRGAVGNWELQKEERAKGISTENLNAIATIFGVNFDWLATGRGEPPKAVIGGAAAGKLGEQFAKSFDPDEPDVSVGFEEEASHFAVDDEAPKIPSNGIVELDARPGMGGGAQVAHIYYRDGGQIETRDAIKLYPWIFPPWFLSRLGARPGDLLVAEAYGDSMRPTIEPGTPLIIDVRHKIPSPDGIYAIRDRWGQVQVKRLETAKGAGDFSIKIISDNGGHTEIVRSEDEISIVGKVLGGISVF